MSYRLSKGARKGRTGRVTAQAKRKKDPGVTFCFLVFELPQYNEENKPGVSSMAVTGAQNWPGG